MTMEALPQDLADFLVTKNFDPEYFDSKGQPAEAGDAKTMKFDYVANTGKNYGTAVIVVADNELSLFYGDNLGRGMDPNDKQEWFEFLEQLSNQAASHSATWSPTEINKLKHTLAGIAAIKEGLFEGYYGNRRVSYMGEQTQARLVINHNRVLGEEDKRFRYVESLFIETADQERFRLGFKSLAGGRAMLEHVRQGGRPYDVRGNHITEIVSEMAVLSRFNRAQHHRVYEGVTQELVESAQQYYRNLQETMKHLGSPRGYQAYFESWAPDQIGEAEALVENLRNLFVEQTLDARIEAALPTLAKIQQQGIKMKEAEIFESWINNLSEGTWALPETPEQMEKLNQLMSAELIVGPDATNATELLNDIVGDDKLFDILNDLADNDPRANIWDDSDVQRRLAELGVQTPQSTQAEPADMPQDTAPAVKEGDGDPQIAPGMKTQYGTVVSVEGNTVTVKASNGEFTTVNIHDIEQAMAEGSLNELAPSSGEGGNSPFDYGSAIIEIGQNFVDNYADSAAGEDAADIIQVGKTFMSAGMTKGISALFALDTQVYDHVLNELSSLGFNVDLDIVSKRRAPTLDRDAQNAMQAVQAKFDAQPGQVYLVTGHHEFGSSSGKIKATSPEAAKQKFIANAGMKFNKVDVASEQGVAEGAMDELHADLNDKFNELAPGIEKYKDKEGANRLYNELVAIAKQHDGGVQALKSMLNGARNSAHMEYDTNPGGFENWFWFLPLGDEQGVAEGDNMSTFEQDRELAEMLKYAGVPVKESVLTDSTGSTLDHIQDRFRREVKNFTQTGDLDDDLYDALYDYYFDDMPYGTKKARDGDPYEWVADRFAQDIGLGEGWKGALAGGLAGAGLGSVVPGLGTLAGGITGAYAGHKIGDQGISDPTPAPNAPGAAAPQRNAPIKMTAADRLAMPSGPRKASFQKTVAEGSCNMTAEGEYCPEHGLMECGSMEEGFLGKLFGTEKKKKAQGQLRPYMIYDKFTIYVDPVDGEWVVAGTGEYENKFEPKATPMYGQFGNPDLLVLYAMKHTGGGSGIRDPLKVNKEALRGVQEDGGAVGMPYSMGEAQAPQDPINSNSAMTGSYYEGKETEIQEGDALLARIKSLALLR